MKIYITLWTPNNKDTAYSLDFSYKTQRGARSKAEQKLTLNYDDIVWSKLLNDDKVVVKTDDGITRIINTAYMVEAYIK